MRSQSFAKLGIALLATLTFVSIASADSSQPPSSTLFVRIRGNAADFVLKKLSGQTLLHYACNDANKGLCAELLVAGDSFNDKYRDIGFALVAGLLALNGQGE